MWQIRGKIGKKFPKIHQTQGKRPRRHEHCQFFTFSLGLNFFPVFSRVEFIPPLWRFWPKYLPLFLWLFLKKVTIILVHIRIDWSIGQLGNRILKCLYSFVFKKWRRTTALWCFCQVCAQTENGTTNRTDGCKERLNTWTNFVLQYHIFQWKYLEQKLCLSPINKVQNLLRP